MLPDLDALAPMSSRFPVSPTGGLVPISDATPSQFRPFGLKFLTHPPIQAGRHEKKETRTTKTRPTRATGDGQRPGGQPDTETYVEITYEES